MGKKILYITANPKASENSFSLTVSDLFISKYRELHPQDTVIHMDVYRDNVPLIDHDVLNAWAKLSQKIAFDDLTDLEKSKISRMNSILDEFISADKYIFSSPLWNLGLPPMLKAYIDNICIAGKTFKYIANGSIGLLQNKKALVITAKGGFYDSEPMASLEMCEKYLINILNFLGIKDIATISLEGMAAIPEKAQEILEENKSKVLELVEIF